MCQPDKLWVNTGSDADRDCIRKLAMRLRSKGIHPAQLDEWREQVTKGALDNLAASRRVRMTSPEAKRIRELEKLRKDKALAETAALLVPKKAHAISGDVDDDTNPKHRRSPWRSSKRQRGQVLGSSRCAKPSA